MILHLRDFYRIKMKQECGTIAQYLKQSMKMVFHVLLEQNCRVGKRQRHVLLHDVQFIFVIRFSCQHTLISNLIAIEIRNALLFISVIQSIEWPFFRIVTSFCIVALCCIIAYVVGFVYDSLSLACLYSYESPNSCGLGHRYILMFIFITSSYII